MMSDLINRQDAIDACHNWDDGENAYAYGDIVIERLQALPSAERKRGEWSLNIDDWFGDCYKCSACGEEFVLNEGTPKDNGYNYCPNCGSEMRGDTDE